MSPAYDRHGVTVHQGDCLDVLATLPDASVHAIVTDPPYLLGFMGRDWDTRAAHEHLAWHGAWAAECLRVLKPGGHLLAFGGSRTWHRLAVAIEDAGFEIRDSIADLSGSDSAGLAWVHGQGFPKGKGQLKPAFEPIVMARKPLAGTVAANVLEHGTGALNIAACRVGTGGQLKWSSPRGMGSENSFADDAWTQAQGRPYAEATASTVGRWPPNVVFTHSPNCAEACEPDCPVAELDRQGGSLTSGGGEKGSSAPRSVYSQKSFKSDVRQADRGGASRFFPVFRWEAKAPASERPKVNGAAHPTVKPLALLRWLVRLVTPPGGTVLDPFLGSGTTAQAARAEGFQCIGIERDETYLPLIRARLSGRPQQVDPVTVASTANEPLDLLDLLAEGGDAA